MLVDHVPVAARGVRLPDLDQLATQRAAVGAEHAAADDDPLAERLALVLAGEVVVELAERQVAEDGARELRERVRKDDERLLRRAQRRAPVLGVEVRRVGPLPVEVGAAGERGAAQCHRHGSSSTA